MNVRSIGDDDREAFHRRRIIMDNPQLNLPAIAGRPVLGVLSVEEATTYVEIVDMQIALKEAVEDITANLPLRAAIGVIGGKATNVFNSPDDAVAYLRTASELGITQAQFLHHLYDRLDCWMHSIEVADGFTVVSTEDRGYMVKQV